MYHMWYSVHYDFKRNRDLLFDLFRRNSRPLRDDLDVVVGYVGIGLDGQIAERDNAAGEKQQGKTQHQQAIVEREINDAANHSYSQLIVCAIASSYCSNVFSIT